MSSYRTKLDCPVCNKRTKAWAYDDYFGPDAFAIACDKCGSIWQKEKCRECYVPESDAPYWKRMNGETSDS